MNPLDEQIGGSHYKNYKIQPVEFIEGNNLSFLQGCIIKRICRFRDKNGIEDLDKIIHEVELLKKLEYGSKDKDPCPLQWFSEENLDLSSHVGISNTWRSLAHNQPSKGLFIDMVGCETDLTPRPYLSHFYCNNSFSILEKALWRPSDLVLNNIKCVTPEIGREIFIFKRGDYACKFTYNGGVKTDDIAGWAYAEDVDKYFNGEVGE